MASVNWDPNRYGSTKKVLSFDSATGNYSIVDQNHSYTGVNYNFASLPTEDTTTTTTTTTTDNSDKTTEMQTAQAFGDVRPWWLKQQDAEGSDNTNVFSGFQEKKEDPFAFEDMRALSARTFEPETEQPSKFKQTISDFGSAIKRGAKGLLDRPMPFFPGMTFLQAANKALRPGANQSFRGASGLYSKEISLMQTYGSTGATQMNPTGDSRKDDAGFNIVSMSGNYNKIGTNSRRHNMLKVADNIIDPIERKNARNKIRSDWEEEKKSGIENGSYNIDSSGSADQAPTQAPSKTATISDAQKRHGGDGGRSDRSHTGHGKSGMGRSADRFA